MLTVHERKMFRITKLCESDFMVTHITAGPRGLGSRPCCIIVMCLWRRRSTSPSASLFTQGYKWVSASCQRKLMIYLNFLLPPLTEPSSRDCSSWWFVYSGLQGVSTRFERRIPEGSSGVWYSWWASGEKCVIPAECVAVSFPSTVPV